MRVTQSMYYQNLYGTNNSQLNSKLFDVNKQIASGIKIQYAEEDVSVFVETMRLDNEITTLGQIKKSAQSGYTVSEQTDISLSEFETSMTQMRTLLLQAANDTNSEISLDAIALELRGIEDHLKSLANTSINGKYLFSGSSIDVKPISDDGTYNGNAASMNAFLGSDNQQQYNLSGAELFLGEEIRTKREITSNVVQKSYNSDTLNGSTTMEEYNGASGPGFNHHFYLRGVQHDGTSFKSHIQLTDTDTIDDLLNQIGQAYGNGAIDVVNVSMNSNGQIVIEDKLKGSSKLDFHMVGATDFGGTNHADITGFTNSVDDLVTNGGETDYALAAPPIPVGTWLFVREYNKSSYSEADGVAAALDGRLYDRTEFTREASKLTSNVPQILKSSYVDSNGDETILKSEANSFATASTTISQVADLSHGTAGTLDGTTFVLDGTDINNNAYSAQINLASAGSTFTVGGNTYNIFDMGTPRAAVDADKMTYQQLMDVMNMVLTANLPNPAPGTDAQYDTAIENSNTLGITTLTHDGKIEFKDLSSSTTDATIALYDQNSDDFAADASVMTFNTNNSLTIRDPKTDFFKTIDEIIKSVENYIKYPDSTVGDKRIMGIENSISMMDDLLDHTYSSHSKVGSNSTALASSIERTEVLEFSTKMLRSEVIDTDIAEASLMLTQLSLNYQAMLSTVSKVSQLSLVNYL